MNKGVCVFDLDSTLGDLRVIDFFGLLFEPKIIPNYYTMNDIQKKMFMNLINDYDDKMWNFMETLKKKFEKEIHTRGLDEGILRSDLKQILQPLVNEFKKYKIEGFIIYSNNANLYALEYTGRLIEKMFDVKKLFIDYLDRNHDIRNKYDGEKIGNRSKMVKTIKLVVPHLKDKNLLFMDDLIHNDFFTTLESTYIQVPAYYNNLSDERLEQIWDTFTYVFDSMDDNLKDDFFNLFHIKKYFSTDNLDEIKNTYLNYSKIRETHVFKENLDMIQDKIEKFINKLHSTKGGYTRYKKYKSRKTHKRRKFM